MRKIIQLAFRIYFPYYGTKHRFAVFRAGRWTRRILFTFTIVVIFPWIAARTQDGRLCIWKEKYDFLSKKKIITQMPVTFTRNKKITGRNNSALFLWGGEIVNEIFIKCTSYLLVYQIMQFYTHLRFVLRF